MLSNLKEGRTDIAVVPTPFQIEKPYTAVHLRPVKTILIGGPRFSGLCRRKNSLRALQKYPLAGLPHVTMSHQFYEDFFAEQGDVYKRQVQGAAGWLDLAIHSLF